MARINEHYLKLKAGYLFPEIGRRVKAFGEAHPQAKIIRMGIGDVTEPLPGAVIEAMHRAVDEMAQRETFRGYGPEQGYEFLREKITQHDYQARGCNVSADEIFVSDGCKCDTGNILDILSPAPGRSRKGNRIAVTDPVYPVYVDTNVMAGRTGAATAGGQFKGLTYLPCTERNGFLPPVPKRRLDVIYLCSPNNPTGVAMTRAVLTEWVEYAKANDALILFDAAYEAYITDPQMPHSIYEIPGGREVAIEFRSFSKLAGFTGTRCAFTVIPRVLTGTTSDGQRVDLHRLWLRRHTTKFNGVSYVTQRGAEAVYSPQGQQQTRALVRFYLENARLIREGLAALSMKAYGGVNSPYIWLKTPGSISSWEFFDKLLNQAHVVTTPGSGFGASGEGFLRLSAFNSRENVLEAMERLRQKLRS